MSELTPKQIQLLDTAVLKIIDGDLHRLIPDRQRELQALQRSHVWVKRELKSRKGSGS